MLSDDFTVRCGRRLEGEDMLVCGGCKQNLSVEAFAVDRMRRTGRRYRCRACSALEFKNWQKTPGYRARLDKQNAHRKTLKEGNPVERWARQATHAARRRAKNRGLTFDLTWEWVAANSPEFCPLLGVPLMYDNDTSLADSAALDRFDNDEGYVRGNCWVISMLANHIKTNATVDQIELLAVNMRALVDRKPDSAIQHAARGVRAAPKTVINPYAQ
jgi:hypothetical protein